jgi:hypothetical protein
MFTISKYVNIPVFLVSLAVGLIGVYLSDPFKRKVYLYPSPDNVDILQYKDKTGACFVYEQRQVKCPSGGDTGVVNANGKPESGATNGPIKVRPQV